MLGLIRFTIIVKVLKKSTAPAEIFKQEAGSGDNQFGKLGENYYCQWLRNRLKLPNGPRIENIILFKSNWDSRTTWKMTRQSHRKTQGKVCHQTPQRREGNISRSDDLQEVLGHSWEKMERITTNKVKEDIRDRGKLVGRGRTEKWGRWGISGGKYREEFLNIQMKILCDRKCRMYTEETSSLKDFF